MKEISAAKRQEAEGLFKKISKLFPVDHLAITMWVANEVVAVLGRVIYGSDIDIHQSKAVERLKSETVKCLSRHQITEATWLVVARPGREIAAWLDFTGWAWFNGLYYRIDFSAGQDDPVDCMTSLVRYVFRALDHARGIEYYLDLLRRREEGQLPFQLLSKFVGGAKGVLEANWLETGKGGGNDA